jgi:hypothetical protein
MDDLSVCPRDHSSSHDEVSPLSSLPSRPCAQKLSLLLLPPPDSSQSFDLATCLSARLYRLVSTSRLPDSFSPSTASSYPLMRTLRLLRCSNLLHSSESHSPGVISRRSEGHIIVTLVRPSQASRLCRTRADFFSFSRGFTAACCIQSNAWMNGR